MRFGYSRIKSEGEGASTRASRWLRATSASRVYILESCHLLLCDGRGRRKPKLNGAGPTSRANSDLQPPALNFRRVDDFSNSIQLIISPCERCKILHTALLHRLNPCPSLLLLLDLLRLALLASLFRTCDFGVNFHLDGLWRHLQSLDHWGSIAEGAASADCPHPRQENSTLETGRLLPLDLLGCHNLGLKELSGR